MVKQSLSPEARAGLWREVVQELLALPDAPPPSGFPAATPLEVALAEGFKLAGLPGGARHLVWASGGPEDGSLYGFETLCRREVGADWTEGPGVTSICGNCWRAIAALLRKRTEYEETAAGRGEDPYPTAYRIPGDGEGRR